MGGSRGLGFRVQGVEGLHRPPSSEQAGFRGEVKGFGPSGQCKVGFRVEGNMSYGFRGGMVGLPKHPTLKPAAFATTEANHGFSNHNTVL